VQVSISPKTRKATPARPNSYGLTRRARIKYLATEKVLVKIFTAVSQAAPEMAVRVYCMLPKYTKVVV